MYYVQIIIPQQDFINFVLFLQMYLFKFWTEKMFTQNQRIWWLRKNTVQYLQTQGQQGAAFLEVLNIHIHKKGTEEFEKVLRPRANL